MLDALPFNKLGNDSQGNLQIRQYCLFWQILDKKQYLLIQQYLLIFK